MVRQAAQDHGQRTLHKAQQNSLSENRLPGLLSTWRPESLPVVMSGHAGNMEGKMIGIQIWHCPGCDRPMKKPGLVSVIASCQHPVRIYPYALCARCTKKVVNRSSNAVQ